MQLSNIVSLKFQLIHLGLFRHHLGCNFTTVMFPHALLHTLHTVSRLVSYKVEIWTKVGRLYAEIIDLTIFLVRCLFCIGGYLQSRKSNPFEHTEISFKYPSEQNNPLLKPNGCP